MKRILFFLLLVCSGTSISSVHVARIVKLENSAQVYVPGVNNEGGFPHVKYLDEVYHVVSATKGFKLKNGYILTTGPDSGAKVIFNNGDHFFVSENTQYKIFWKREALGPDDPSLITLLRGTVRSLIQKGGPRSGMKVKTSSTVMGVRGTDFQISERRGDINLSVLRGEVELLSEDPKKASVKVKSGQTLIKENKKIEVTKLAKEDLQQMAKVSMINDSLATDKTEDAKELDTLEKQATKTTLDDIKEYRPDLYKELTEKQQSDPMTSDALAINVVKIMEKTATSRLRKANRSELEDNSNPYEEYKSKK